MVQRQFKRYTLPDYIEQVLRPNTGKVYFSKIHVHGTWRPTIADYRKEMNKERIIQIMWRAHLLRGFTDIAQHASIDPEGYIWDGRSLLVPPASAYGNNDPDNDGVHPFMFEMIGNFDYGNEKLEGPQLSTSVGLTRAVMYLWGRVTGDIRFHREMQPGKTCPGSAITKEWFLDQVADASLQKPKLGDPVIVRINGKHITDGRLIDGQTWTPARRTGEALGAAVGWQQEARMVTVNGIPFPTVLIGGSGYVALRELAEAVNATVAWDARTQSVYVTKKKNP
ncbi:stalk domain-containing protein [Paenibacillus alkalitolerans]|uniref:stalk domain-containing protein n=1 Tax=Paenibacillus alkalitolerans TaxID=2799335 RepID=UPI0018F6B629|nr:hypothetical protein [Paenibacillus alkalitolerans]